MELEGLLIKLNQLELKITKLEEKLAITDKQLVIYIGRQGETTVAGDSKSYYSPPPMTGDERIHALWKVIQIIDRIPEHIRTKVSIACNIETLTMALVEYPDINTKDIILSPVLRKLEEVYYQKQHQILGDIVVRGVDVEGTFKLLKVGSINE